MWELAIQEFRTSYVNDVQFATESLNKIKQNINIVPKRILPKGKESYSLVG